MTHLPPRGAGRIAVSLVHAVALLLAFAILATDVAAATIDFTLGPKEVIYTKKQRSKKKLGTWPDGNLGVVSNGNGTYDFYGANGTSPVRTTGTLTDPGTSKKSVKILNVPKKTYNYVSGGPVYQDPTTGTRLMVYHAEKHGKSAKDYYSVLGLAIATDASGLSFWDLGTIVEPDVPHGQQPFSIEVGGGSFAVLDDYFNVYYRDYAPGGASSELAVARARLSDLIGNSLAGQATAFNKYYNGTWSEPGRGGRSSPLEVGNPPNMWSSVSYNDYLDQLVMVSAAWTPTQPDLYMATSSDGVNWSPRQAIDVGAGEQFYPSIVGTGPDPSRTGQSFYVYYTDSPKGGWNRWKDAALVRRSVTFDAAAPVTPPVVPPPPPVPSEWILISDFKSDFKTGGPATGWTYAWNPTGALGNSAAFSALKWSSAIQAYNTTGGALTVPANGTAHSDDYLHLTAAGTGHPGMPGYMPIVGYTIQAGDGTGPYRIADSSIAKLDSITSSGEDGLQVSVYVNNTKLGSTASVSTNGAVANFDRELGQLNVGDTVWVAINAMSNYYYDSFTGFDFSIERSVPLAMMAMGGGQLSATAAPEPATAGMLLVAAGLGCLWRRR